MPEQELWDLLVAKASQEVAAEIAEEAAALSKSAEWSKAVKSAIDLSEVVNRQPNVSAGTAEVDDLLERRDEILEMFAASLALPPDDGRPPVLDDYSLDDDMSLKVKMAQADLGLEVDGIVGDATWNALLHAVGMTYLEAKAQARSS